MTLPLLRVAIGVLQVDDGVVRRVRFKGLVLRVI